MLTIRFNMMLLCSLIPSKTSAFVYWVKHPKLQKIAKNGTVKQVTQLVNGGLNGCKDRKRRFNILATLIGIEGEE